MLQWFARKEALRLAKEGVRLPDSVSQKKLTRSA